MKNNIDFLEYKWDLFGMHKENVFVIPWLNSSIHIHRDVFIAVMYLREFGDV